MLAKKTFNDFVSLTNATSNVTRIKGILALNPATALLFNPFEINVTNHFSTITWQPENENA